MATPNRMPVTDPATGQVIERDQPGYYKGFSTLDQQGYWDEATRKLVLERMSKVLTIRFFTPDEARTMAAVVDRILPQEDRSPTRRIPLLPGIDDRLFMNRIDGYRYEDMPSDQDAYRIAAKAFEEMARTVHGKSFDELETIQQETLIQSVHAEKPAAAVETWKGVNLKRFWPLLLSDCCGVYYAHPWAWDEVGFGGPAYPRGYMRLEEGQPEPWEVDEQRYQWAAPSDTISGTKEAEDAGDDEQSSAGQGGTH